MFGVTILGNNSAVPAFNRHPTSQVVTYEGNNFLVDCGEGTQIQMINYKIRRGKISHIFISHLHGDHYFGLIGLISSFGLLSHTQDLHIFGPPALKEIIELQLKMADTHLPYELFIHAITGPGLLVETEKMRIECFRTNHRIECFGFKFTEKKPARKILADKAREMQVPMPFFDHLKTGADYISKDGMIVKNEEVTLPGDKGRSYAFCADTRYDEALLEHITGLDMIYHETTYLDNFRERAEDRFHSTTRQAATMALKAGVKRLLIGHFSSKYDSLEEFEKESREIFPNTDLALEGTVYTIA